MNALTIAEKLATACKSSGKNAQSVKDMPDDEFDCLMGDPLTVDTLTKPIQKCLASRRKREDAAELKAEKQAMQVTVFVAGNVPDTGGVWVHDLAARAKEAIGKWVTKWVIESAARKFPNLTLRRVDYGEPGQSALAIFKGKQIPVENHEEIPLL